MDILHKQTNERSGLGWILMLFEASENYGYSPLDMTILHRVVYLANVICPIYKIIMPDSYTIKNMRGPYFPNVQRDVNSLIIKGLLTPNNIKPYKDEHGFWLDGEFRISVTGLKVFKNITQNSSINRISLFLREFIRSINDLSREELIKLAESEIHYNFSADSESLDFSFPDNNISLGASNEMYPNDRIRTTRESIHRYMLYMKKYSLLKNGCGDV